MAKEKKREKKIVHFPNLAPRLVEKGMSSLKAKKYKESLNCFQQLLELDPMHPQGHLGTVLSLVELGDLVQAKQRAENMLKQAIGEYYDVLQIYLSILIQLSEYKTVVSTIEAVLEENQLPADKAETFYQLLHFSRKVLDQDPWPHLAEQPGNEMEPPDLHTYEKMLFSDKPSSQWIAVQQLKHYGQREVLSMFKAFLVDEQKHPAVKSIILQYLKEQGVHETVSLFKNGEVFTVKVQELFEWDSHPFHVKVKRGIMDILEHENPSLMDFALAVWRDYMLTTYPIIPDQGMEELWAKASVAAAEVLCGLIAHPEESDGYENKMEHLVQQLLDMERIYLES